MARCGCTPKCNCVMQSGQCTKVNLVVTGGGCGDSNNSFTVDVVADEQTIFCGANGLEARITHVDTNTVNLDGLGTAGSPLQADVILTPDANVPNPNNINPNPGNLIKEGAPGIYVSCEDVQDCVGAAIEVVTAGCLDYDDANNTISVLICAEPNGIECVAAGDPNCPAGGLSVTPSTDPNNSLTFGTDGRLFAPAAAIIPGECMTFTGTGTQADPFVISPLIAPELNGVECVPGQGLLVTPSADANNGLVFGGDTRLWINRCPLVLGGSQVLTGNTGPCFELVGGDCNVPMVATLRISDDICQGLQCRADGLYVQADQTNLPPAVSITRVIGARGPFNGTTPAGTFVVDDGPQCVTITNPSPCRDMDVSGRLSGFAEVGRNTGEMRAQFKVNEAGNTGTPTLPGPPWFTVSQVGQANPTPPSRQTGNVLWQGTKFPLGPGGSRTMCAAVTHTVAAATNGRIFNAQYIFEIIGTWSL